MAAPPSPTRAAEPTPVPQASEPSPLPSANPDPTPAASPDPTQAPTAPPPVDTTTTEPDAAADPGVADLRPELVDRRTETSRTFDNGDGTTSTEFYPDPINYKPAGAVNWEPIELTFALTDLHQVSFPGSSYQMVTVSRFPYYVGYLQNGQPTRLVATIYRYGYIWNMYPGRPGQ